MSDREDRMVLDTGMLTEEQLNLLVTHLPFEISFVDEEDTVVFFNKTERRAFDRSPGAIGRKVQHCHPHRSLHRVERILDAFRAGERDTAEFWLEHEGRFVHVRYLAVRDRERRYRGCLEVAQDATELRALRGERRLLDGE